MSNISYDLDKLMKSGNIDTKSGLKNFNSQQEYFDKLTEFTSASGSYLTEYRPEIIASRDSVRKKVLKELYEVRSMLTLLGMANMCSDFRFLESAILKKDVASMTTELAEFHTDMKKISKQICLAQLPITENLREKAEPIQQESAKPIILAVDDKPVLLAAIVGMLKDDFTVVGVTSGAAALKALEKHTPEYFLLDIEMPQMDGYELAKLIRDNEKFKDTPIVFLTSQNSRDSVIEAVKHGGNDYLLKPVEKDLLLSKIWQRLR